MEEPCVECEIESSHLREALAELGCHHHAGTLVAVGGDYGTGIVRSAVPNAAEPALAQFNVRFKHLSDRFAEREVCVAGYGGVDVRMHIGARGGFFSDGRHELGLAEGLHVLGAVGAVHGRAFEEDGADDVVPGSEVAQQVVEHVVVAGPLPEVVMRVADRQVGVDGVFLCELQPVFAWGDHGVPPVASLVISGEFKILSLVVYRLLGITFLQMIDENSSIFIQIADEIIIHSAF